MKIVYVVLFFALAILFVWSRIHVVELGYEVSTLKGKVEKIKQENGILKSKVSGGMSTEDLLRYAERFGMTPPLNDQIIFIQEK